MGRLVDIRDERGDSMSTLAESRAKAKFDKVKCPILQNDFPRRATRDVSDLFGADRECRVRGVRRTDYAPSPFAPCERCDLARCGLPSFSRRTRRKSEPRNERGYGMIDARRYL
ncbi:hypothetical protein EVAR_10158_1 [Eumeta japonica]|uniref:Uncharacterized protein n=1 Tax=Eumeta variegata TaxID=151549 RepID=A0A4C1UD55_EUMVA|nr:hypothetical protein EVAR_10158_1 [Eumeta japonica]